MESKTAHHFSRRELLESFLVASCVPLIAEGGAQTQVPGAAPRPFRVDVPQATIDRMRCFPAGWLARFSPCSV